MHPKAIRTAVLLLWCLPGPVSVALQSARADTRSPHVVLGPGVKDLVVGPGMNAAGRDLRGSEFVTQDLTGANFDGCNFYGVLMDGCTLIGASFRGAILAGGKLDVAIDDHNVDVTDATINGVIGLYGVYGLRLSPLQLMSTRSYRTKDLRQCHIYAPRVQGEPVRFDFRGADLRETRFYGDFSETDFTDALIDGAYFGNDMISFEKIASTRDFRSRRLRVRLSSRSGITAASSPGEWDFSRINLAGSDLSFNPSDVNFTDATIRNCTIRHGLTREQLYSTRSYQQGDLAGLQLWSIDLSGWDLSGMNLTGTRFTQCTFAGTNLEDAVITGAQFSSSHGLTLDQIQSTWNYKQGRMEGIEFYWTPLSGPQHPQPPHAVAPSSNPSTPPAAPTHAMNPGEANRTAEDGGQEASEPKVSSTTHAPPARPTDD